MKFSINQAKTGLGELQTSLHWHVSIVNPSTAAGPMDENLEIRVQTSTIPRQETTTTKVELQGHTLNFTGKTTTNGEIALRFLESTDGAVIDYFSKWVAKRWESDGTDVTGKQELTADVKADLKLDLLGPDDEVTRSYTLIGCMPRVNSENTMGQEAEAWIEEIVVEYDSHHMSVAGEISY